jgi:hypothetical protein
MVIAVAALVGGRLIWVKAGRPAHRQEIAAAFGSVRLFYGVPQVNPAGNRFTFVATGAKAYGLFHCDTATGVQQIVCEENFGPVGDVPNLRAWPWSPDGRAFVYTLRDQLFVCPADDFKAATPLATPVRGMADLVWLNAAQFAWLEGEVICHAKKSAAGRWETQRLPRKIQIANLTAIDENTIAWLQQNFICRLDLNKDIVGTNNPFAAARPEPPGSPLTNDLILWLDASTLQLTNGAPVTTLADLSRNRNFAVANRNPPLFTAPDNIRALNKKGTIHFTPGRSIGEATGLRTIRRLGLAGSQARTVFSVMRRRAAGGEMLIGIGDTGGRGTYFGISEKPTIIYLPAGWGDADNIVPCPVESWKLFAMDHDGTTQNGYVNGALAGTRWFQLNTAEREVEIGLRTGKNEAASEGDFAELLVYNRALNASERRQVENYLNWKWFGDRMESAKSPLVWFDPQMDGLVGFRYSRETGQFLIRRAAQGVDELWRVDPAAAKPDNRWQIAASSSMDNEQWAGGNRWAFASRAPKQNGVTLADASGAGQSRLFQQGNIKWFAATPDTGKMLILGTITNEPSAGIWQYDLASRELKPVVPCSDYPSSHARNIAPTPGAFTLPSGRSVSCTIYPPANFDWHKKYPVVLGNTYFGSAVNGAHGRLWVPGMAACGAFVVIIDRWSWGGGIEQWEENVLGVYQCLLRDPRVDARRVYLFGASAETQYMSECLARSPGLWQGAIFLNPTQLPDFSKSPPFQSRPKILVSVGSEEFQEGRLKKFQAEALASGALVEVVVHPGEYHHLFGNIAQLERTRAMMRFIFE